MQIKEAEYEVMNKDYSRKALQVRENSECRENEL